MNNGSTPQLEPVTFIVSREVKEGCEADYEAWVRGVSHAALQFDGHMGVNVIRPGSKHAHHNEYVVIFRFDNYSNLRRWVQSDVRQEWLERVKPFTVGEPQVQIETGLEYWFTLPDTLNRPTPPRYKQTLLTWAAIFPLSLAVNFAFRPLLDSLSLIPRTMLTTALLVSMLSYVIMPRLTKVFRKWLYSPAR